MEKKLLLTTLVLWKDGKCIYIYIYNGGFTLDVKSMFNENLGGILGGTQC